MRLLFTGILIFVCLNGALGQGAISGTWKTYDDNTQMARSYVKIWQDQEGEFLTTQYPMNVLLWMSLVA